MPKLILDISMSLDGFVAGPNPSLDDPLGQGGERLHEWAFPTRAFREPHGRSGGEDNEDSRLISEHLARIGATIMGRRMFSGGEGPWEEDRNADGWWGEAPPFRHPVFVLTHHPREPLVKEGTTFTFVTDGIESALRQAREAAAGKDVQVGGGADAAQQYLRAGLLDELRIHVAPVLLGAGRPLFERAAFPRPELECVSVTGSRAVAHLTYRTAPAGG